jgi:hypothetical protein
MVRSYRQVDWRVEVMRHCYVGDAVEIGDVSYLATAVDIFLLVERGIVTRSELHNTLHSYRGASSCFPKVESSRPSQPLHTGSSHLSSVKASSFDVSKTAAIACKGRALEQSI